MSTLARDVERYERWLKSQCRVVKKDLRHKHERMRESAFVFLRATYFRWARTIEQICPEFSDAPRVPCVGDIHVENYGTWRDAEGRQVWGVNDFDEAAVMPYAYDLIRLVTSARLSPHLAPDSRRAADAVLEGYLSRLGDPAPVLLHHDNPWSRTLARHLGETVEEFWADVAKYPDALPPAQVQRALRRSLPPNAVVQRFATRRTGGGGLGRPRFLAIAEWRGGLVVREAKAMVPSAWNWAHAKAGRSRLLDIAYGAHRAPDPTLSVAAGFLLRRVAPESRKLDLGDGVQRTLGVAVLEAMGGDLGAVHAAHRRSAAIIDHLALRDSGWLHQAADRAQRAVEADYRTWLALPDHDEASTGSGDARRKRPVSSAA